MKTKDMLEDYLLSLEVSIKNKYTFLPKTDYDFKDKKKDETVKLGKYNIKLSQQYANSRELRLMLNSAKDNFISKVTITEDMHKSCEGIVKNSVIYFTDLIKYLDSILELKPEIMEKLIILCNAGIANVGKEIENALSEYSVKMAQAQAEGAQEAQSSLLSSMADIESKKSTYMTVDTYHDPIYGNRAVGYISSGFADKAMAEGMMAGARHAASIIGNIPVEVASKNAIEKLKGIRVNILKKFNSSVFEFVCAKFPKVFDEDILDNKGNNIEENPTYHQYYIDIIKDLKEEDMENFNKVTKYYDIDVNLESELKDVIVDEMVNYYLKNFKCDYDSQYYKLYRYLKFNEESLMIRVGDRLHKYFLDLPDPSNKNKYFAKIDELQPKLAACDYITDENKKKITDAYDSYKTKIIEKRRNRAIDTTLTIISIIVFIAVAAVAIWHSIVFEVYPEYNMSGWTFLGVLVVGAIIVFTMRTDESKTKNIILGVIIGVLACLPIYYLPRISNELAFREGKVLIKKSFPDKETAEYIKIGESIELESINESGYYFNGWVSHELNRTIVNPQTAKTDDRFSAYLVEKTETTRKITFKYKNGEKDRVMYQNEGFQLYVPEDPVRKGYVFAGWYNKTTKTDFDDFLYRAEDKNVVFEAKWRKA